MCSPSVRRRRPDSGRVEGTVWRSTDIDRLVDRYQEARREERRLGHGRAAGPPGRRPPPARSRSGPDVRYARDVRRDDPPVLLRAVATAATLRAGEAQERIRSARARRRTGCADGPPRPAPPAPASAAASGSGAQSPASGVAPAPAAGPPPWAPASAPGSTQSMNASSATWPVSSGSLAYVIVFTPAPRSSVSVSKSQMPGLASGANVACFTLVPST